MEFNDPKFGFTVDISYWHTRRHKRWMFTIPPTNTALTPLSVFATVTCSLDTSTIATATFTTSSIITNAFSSA
jgi:hypothetical protein